MAKDPCVSPELIRQLLKYDPQTGKLFWRSRLSRHNAFNGRFAGKEAFTYVMPKGHKQGRIYDKAYLAHRVIWALVYGEWPVNHIDHINGDPGDNRITNLRDVNNAENHKNMKRPKTNKTGVLGISWDKARAKWRVRLRVDGIEKMIGRYDDFGEAVAARNMAYQSFGYHPNHGRC